MSSRQLKTIYFGLTAVHTYATTHFLYFLFFLLHQRFGFEDRHNLWVTAMHGFIYMFSAWQCGKFAERRGFLTSLKVGYSGLALLMIVVGLFPSLPVILSVLVLYSIVLLFTWPALEALVTENESRAGVQHAVGVYNCTWAGGAALAYFTGGKLYDWSHGQSVFWLPAILFVAQLLVVLWISPRAASAAAVPRTEADEPELPHPEAVAYQQPVRPEGFLKMAWLANPFAYVAVNTLLAVIPGIANRLGLSPTEAGLFCSTWQFARVIAFAFLWKWTGWHYRFRWLLTAYLVLAGSFLVLLSSGQLWVVIVVQIFFGFAAGLIYYSSLFYSMDVGETKGEHGGLHEAAIGAGIFAGPAVTAASLQAWPQYPNAGAIAAGSLLFVGLTGLLFIWGKERWR